MPLKIHSNWDFTFCALGTPVQTFGSALWFFIGMLFAGVVTQIAAKGLFSSVFTSVSFQHTSLSG